MNLLFKTKILFLLILLFIAESLVSGPYLNIQKIDSTSEFPTIKLEVIVSDLMGSDLSALDEENLTIYEDGFRLVDFVKIQNLSDSNDILYLVFSIDSSKSISNEFLNSIKSSAIKIINSIGPKDKIAIYRFNNEVKILNSFTSDKKLLLKNLQNISRHGEKTLLYNSIYDSIELLSKIKETKNAIIVFTDGKDEGSSINEDDVIKYARELGFPIYFICLKSSKNIKILARISKLTGGNLVYSSDNNKVLDMYKTVLTFNKNRYIIKYKSMVKPDGYEHSIEIKLKYKDIRDSEIVKFKTERMFLFLLKPVKWNIILLSIVILLLIILLLLIIHFTRKEKRVLSKMFGKNGEIPRIKQASSNNTELIPNEILDDDLLYLDDPDYSYSDAWLVKKSGTEAGEKFPIYLDEVIIGRDKECNIIVNDETVSLKHSKIKNINGKYVLFDLVSENGTYLNRKKLLRPKLIYDWDEIKIGRSEFIFRGSKISV